MMEDNSAPVRREGCTGKGCAILLALVSLLGLALLAGTLWGVHYMRRYAATEAQPIATPARATTGTQSVMPALTAGEAEAATVKWRDFLEAIEGEEAARVELSAAEINSLIESAPETRGKVSVTVGGDVGRVRISLPLEGVFMMEGRFLNAELQVEAAPDGDPAKARIFNLTLNGQSVPEEFLNRSLFGFPSLRTLVNGWVKELRLTTFRIENDRVIGETGPTA